MNKVMTSNNGHLRISKKGLNSRGLFVTSVLFFRLLLDASYIHIIYPVFASTGFVLQVDSLKLMESYFAILLLALIIPLDIKKPSSLLILFLFLMPVIPMLSLYGLRDESRGFTYMMITGFLIILGICRLPKVNLKRLKGGRMKGIVLCVGAVLVVLVLLISRGGLAYFNLDLARVYYYRDYVGAIINVGFFAYLNVWVFRVFNITLMAWALLKKRYSWFLLILGLQVLFFAISTHKAVLFSPIFVITLYVFAERKHILHLIVLGLSGVVGVCWAIAVFTGNIVPASLFIRRLLFVPAHLNYAYYEFFSQAGHVFMSNSVLSFLFDYPFPYPPPQMISKFLLGHTDMWANTGFLATSYMHFGFLGVIVFSIIVGLLIRLVDGLVADKLPLWFGLSIVIVPFFVLFTSSDLTTALLSHGVGLSLFLLWLFSAREMSNKRFSVQQLGASSDHGRMGEEVGIGKLRLGEEC